MEAHSTSKTAHFKHSQEDRQFPTYRLHKIESLLSQTFRGLLEEREIHNFHRVL
jgi:hypothetical protein